MTDPATPPPPGRNAPCPCGSGKRYKDCHGTVGGSAFAAGEMPVDIARRGVDAHRRNDLESAEALYRRALAIDPDQPLAVHYLGVAHYQCGRLDDAQPLLDRAVTLAPDEPEFHNNRGLALAARLLDQSAVDAYRRALALKPDHAGAWNNIGLALQALGDLGGAIDAYHHALRFAPESSQTHWNLGLALLTAGDLAAGWPEYEWRLRAPEMQPFIRRWNVPRWQGEAVAGRTVLLHAEQGLGDTLQNLRFAQAVANLGARVVVSVQAPLVQLAATAPGVAAVVGPDDPLPAIDLHVPMMSLPLVLGATREQLRMTHPYLRSEVTRRLDAEALIGAHAGKALRVGLSWSGAVGNRYNLRRACSLDVLAPLLRLADIRWFSLQKDSAEYGNAGLDETQGHPIVELPMRNDFAGTAALVDALDIIVSVDTSIAHLAGALGRPLLLLLPFAPDWRWGTRGSDAVWYPTAQLFRQRVSGDWSDPIARVQAVLTAMTPRLQRQQ